MLKPITLDQQIEFIRRTRHMVNMPKTKHVQLDDSASEMLQAIETTLVNLKCYNDLGNHFDKLFQTSGGK